jgi:hypothetical protein
LCRRIIVKHPVSICVSLLRVSLVYIPDVTKKILFFTLCLSSSVRYTAMLLSSDHIHKRTVSLFTGNIRIVLRIGLRM